MTMTETFVTTAPALPVHVEDGVWWTTCPKCPGWSAAADSWDELFQIVSEWHRGGASHRDWLMISPVVATTR